MSKYSAHVPIVVPRHVRQRLQPYSELFESIVIPHASQSPTRSSVRQAIELREALEARQLRTLGHLSHPALLEYALLLCCYHTLVETSRSRPAQMIVIRSWRSIKNMFRHYQKEDALTML